MTRQQKREICRQTAGHCELPAILNRKQRRAMEREIAARLLKHIKTGVKDASSQ